MTTMVNTGPAEPADTPHPAEVDAARVAVLVSTHQVDVVLPIKFSIETFIDDLLAVLTTVVGDVDFTPPAGQWSLARPGQEPIPRWQTLEDYDIADGAVLALCPVESTEVFTPVIEDITDALAMINEREFAEFDSAASALVGLAALVAGAVAVSAMLAWSWTSTASIGWSAAPALVLGLVCCRAAFLARSRYQSPRACLGLTLAAVPLMSVGAAMLVPPPYGHPGPFAAANLAAGSVVAATVAATMLWLTRLGVATLVSVTTLGVLGFLAALPMTYLDASVGQMAAAAVLEALVLLGLAPRLAVAVARIRPPDLPDPGDEVAPGTLNDIFDTATEASTEPELGLESRARLAVTSLIGLIVAVAVVIPLAVVIVQVVNPGGVRGIMLGVLMAVILVLRRRSYPDRVQAIALVTGALVTALSTALVLTVLYQTAPARAVVAGLFVLVVVVGSVAAMLLPGARLSPVTRRLIDITEYLLIIIVPILAFSLMGIYTAMRQI